MKIILMIFLLAAPCARAGWNDLKEGLDPATAERCVGAPLFGNRSRGGMFVNWVYDNGGYILFENGRVRFWQQPLDKTGGATAFSSVPASASAASHATRNSASASPEKSAGSNGMTLHW